MICSNWQRWADTHVHFGKAHAHTCKWPIELSLVITGGAGYPWWGRACWARAAYLCTCVQYQSISHWANAHQHRHNHRRCPLGDCLQRCNATNYFRCQPRSSRIKAPGASSEDELLLPFAWNGSSIEELFREKIFVGRYDFTMDYVTRTRASSVYTPVSPRSDSPCSGASGEW